VAKMNDMPEQVVSSTLREATWTGSQLVRGDVLAAVRQLKAQPGGDLLLAGSAQLFRALTAANLVDRYRLMVHPVVLGGGAKLFADGDGTRDLTLVETRTYKSGIVVLEYEPKKA